VVFGSGPARTSEQSVFSKSGNSLVRSQLERFPIYSDVHFAGAYLLKPGVIFLICSFVCFVSFVSFVWIQIKIYYIFVVTFVLI
jgi:hypothetical protein